jgi:hypothetical protein
MSRWACLKSRPALTSNKCAARIAQNATQWSVAPVGAKHYRNLRVYVDHTCVCQLCGPARRQSSPSLKSTCLQLERGPPQQAGALRSYSLVSLPQPTTVPFMTGWRPCSRRELWPDGARLCFWPIVCFVDRVVFETGRRMMCANSMFEGAGVSPTTII